jgi:hypothetical protein
MMKSEVVQAGLGPAGGGPLKPAYKRSESAEPWGVSLVTDEAPAIRGRLLAESARWVRYRTLSDGA